MQTLSTRPRYTPKNIPVILTLASGAWLVLSAGIYLAGLGAVTTLSLIGGAL